MTVMPKKNTIIEKILSPNHLYKIGVNCFEILLLLLLRLLLFSTITLHLKSKIRDAGYYPASLIYFIYQEYSFRWVHRAISSGVSLTYLSLQLHLEAVHNQVFLISSDHPLWPR